MLIITDFPLAMKETTATKMAKDRLRAMLRGAKGQAVAGWKANMSAISMEVP